MSVRHDRSSASPAGSSGGAGAGADDGRDLLSDVLETVRLRGTVFFLWEPSWPYATSVPDGASFAPVVMPGADQVASYHIVTQGPCWGSVSGEEPVQLETGDILLVPRGDAYVIASEPCQPSAESTAPAREFFRQMAAGMLPPVVRDGGGGPGSNRLVCGFLGCDMRPFNPLLAALPRLLRIPAPATPDDPLKVLVDLARAESGRGLDGQRCMLLRLSELMFVEVIRRYLRSPLPGEVGWLPALRDPLVGRALALMHGRVAEPWTLERLAGELATSRTVLAERFSTIVGEPPMQYLARWRMQVAARALADGHAKVYAVAGQVGYESEAAFSRAFKRIVGMTPAAWRRQRSAGGATAVSRAEPP